MPSPWFRCRTGRWSGFVLALALLPLGALPASAQVTPGDAQLVGRWTSPFEEGGITTPRCSTAEDGHLVCKPVAQAMAALPDGRVFYFNGLEGQENSHRLPTELSAGMRDSTSRLLDLRTGAPLWTIPSHSTGGGVNPNIRRAPVPDAAGVAGIPGRSGDGLVGSAAGLADGDGMQPTSPPDDAEANDGDMFCSDITLLSDGRLLIAGGADWYNEPGVSPPDADPPVHAGVPEVEGLRSSRLFDPRTDSFHQASPMKYGRWHPALVTLPDGKVLAVGGATKRVKNTQLSQVRRTETFDPATNSWSDNYTGLASENSLPLSPRLHLLVNGKVLYTGAGETWAPFGAAVDEATFGLEQLYDPEKKQWEILSPNTLGARDGAFSILLPLDPPYDRSTVLTFGGTLGAPPGTDAGVLYSTLTSVDRDGKYKEKLTRYPMYQPRWSPSGVGLPDGTVLAVAGATNRETEAPGAALAVRTTELYDPRTETWYQMSRSGRDRTYHHSAILLPDARVLLGGHAPAGSAFGPGTDVGGPFANNERDPSFEIFSPHYLFRGPRPRISHVQAGLRWGETFPIVTPQFHTIESVVLIRLPSPQHSIDSDMRTVRLAFTRSTAGYLRVEAPPDGAVAPPGYYYLFINRQTRRGPSPSVARVVHVGAESDVSESTQPYPNDAGGTTGGSATATNDSSVQQLLPADLSDAVDLLVRPQHDDAARSPGVPPLGFIPAGSRGEAPVAPSQLPLTGVLAAGVSLVVGRRWIRRPRRVHR